MFSRFISVVACISPSFLFMAEFFFKFYLLIFGCVGSLLLCAWLSLVAVSGGLLFVAVRGLLITVASLVAEHGL